MQATYKEIYEQVGEKHNVSYDTVKLVGDAVFKEWADHLKKPQSIILKIKKLGRMYLRKNRLDRKICNIYVDQETTEIYEERLKEYEQFVLEKKEMQAMRREFQTIVPKLNREEE